MDQGRDPDPGRWRRWIRVATFFQVRPGSRPWVLFEIILPEAVMFMGVSLVRFAQFMQNTVSLPSGLLVFVTC